MSRGVDPNTEHNPYRLNHYIRAALNRNGGLTIEPNALWQDEHSHSARPLRAILQKRAQFDIRAERLRKMYLAEDRDEQLKRLSHVRSETDSRAWMLDTLLSEAVQAYKGETGR